LGESFGAPDGAAAESRQSEKRTRPLILLVDDDVALNALMSEYFTDQGFRIEIARDGREGLARVLLGGISLVILDVSMPHLDGFEVLRRVRQRSSVPVIMLTARVSPEDRIAGLEGGADDYLQKPFEPAELVARVRAVLRRSGEPSAGRRSPIQIGDVRLNPATREVYRSNVKVPVTSVEFDILAVLMRAAGRTVSRDEIATVLYQRELTPFERAVDVHVSHLRKKLDMQGPELIRTVRGAGYMFVLEQG
jgi:two-component system response regulator CpxR